MDRMFIVSRRWALLAILCAALVVTKSPDPVAAQGPSLTRLTTSIASGQSVTASIDLKDQPIVAIEMPESWTAADLTVQGSNDGTTFKDAYTAYGDEYTITAAASRYIVLSPFEFQWARFIKIRSGTSGTPVNQGGARTLVLITRRVL